MKIEKNFENILYGIPVPYKSLKIMKFFEFCRSNPKN